MSTVSGEIERFTVRISASIVLVLVVVLVLESARAVGLGLRRFCGQMSNPFVVPEGTE